MTHDLLDTTPFPFRLDHECKYNALTFWMWGVFGNILCILGLAGNVMTLFVLSQMTPKTSVLVYITAVCASDAIVLFFTSVTVLSVSAFGYLPSNLDYVNGISKGFPAFYFLAEVFRYLNTYLTVALCVDRYLSVCHARKAQDMCTKKRALIAISAIICSNVVFNVPKVFEYTWEQDELMPNCTIVNETDFANEDGYKNVYLGIFDPLLGSLLPLLTMVVLTVLTVLTLRKSRFLGLGEEQRRRTLRATNRVTWMCITVVIVYIVCQVPIVVIYTAMGLGDEGFSKTTSGHQIQRVVVILVLVNSSVNFVVYCLISPNFRKVFVTTIGCKCLQYKKVALEEASQTEYSKNSKHNTRITTVT